MCPAIPVVALSSLPRIVFLRVFLDLPTFFLLAMHMCFKWIANNCFVLIVPPFSLRSYFL